MHTIRTPRRKRTALIRCSGPYDVDSYSQTGAGYIYFVVWPAYPEEGTDWPERRGNGEGGGPGIFTNIAVARQIEEFLNAPYSPADVTAWKERAKPGITAESTPVWVKERERSLLRQLERVEEALQKTGFHFAGCSEKSGHECDCYRTTPDARL